MTDLDHHFDQITDHLDSWRPINLNTLPEQPPVQPTLGKVGDIGLLYPGKRHVFSGPQESAKTLAAYAIGLQVARTQGIVVLIDFEMGAYDARNRLRELGATPEDLDALMYLEPDQPATTDRLNWFLQHYPALVIIDAAVGAYDLQGLDDNKRQDVEKLARLYVRTFWKAGVATIFIDHVTKNSDTRGNYAIGSERKVGGADVHLGFSVITPISRGHTGLYKITTHKDRGGYLKRGVLAEMELQSDPITHHITWTIRPAAPVDEEHPWMPTKVMQKVSEMLEKETQPISRNQIVAFVGGNKDYVLQAIEALVQHGYAHQTDGPNRSKLTSHTRPFTVLEWEKQLGGSVVPSGSTVVPGTSQLSGSVPLPPYGGGEPLTGLENNPVVPDYSWVDELTPRDEPEDPPGDLWPEATPDDGIPF